MKQFESAAESLEEFFKTLERFELVNTLEFSKLYVAKSKVEADILVTQH